MTVPSARGDIPQFTLADRLLKARKHAGLEQKELAEAIGIARTSVVRYEQGESTPRRPVLIAWALATGVDSEWIFEGGAQGKELARVGGGFKSTLRSTFKFAA
jgi:transcriptional regulator with XRE-family HTH domain